MQEGREIEEKIGGSFLALDQLSFTSTHTYSHIKQVINLIHVPLSGSNSLVSESILFLRNMEMIRSCGSESTVENGESGF